MKILFISIIAYSFLCVNVYGKDVWEGVYTEAQAIKGKQSYLEYCSECHGSTLEGIAEAPRLRQGAFIYNWDGLPINILFQRIRETMPMDDPKGVSRKLKADILAYIMKENNLPSGNIPLPYQNSRLKSIQWNAQKTND